MNIESESDRVNVQQSRILRTLLENDALLESTCRPYEDHILLEYINAELNDQDAATLYPAFRAHLDQSPECWQEYIEVKQLLLLEQTGQLVEPPVTGTFDFSFLTKASAQVQDVKPLFAASFWRLDVVGRLIIEFSTELLRTLQPPARQLAYAAERAEQGARIRYQLALEQGLEDLSVTITARDAVTQPDLYTLVVEANIPSRGGWPHLADTEVTLKRSDQILEQQHTDAFGKAVFSNVFASDLAHLIIEIAPDRG
jgi:hypothetical protein